MDYDTQFQFMKFMVETKCNNSTDVNQIIGVLYKLVKEVSSTGEQHSVQTLHVYSFIYCEIKIEKNKLG